MSSPTQTTRPLRPDDGNGNSKRRPLFRTRLLKLHVPRNRTEAEATYKRLGKNLESLSAQGYNPTSVTGVGEHLFILMEHERTLQQRLFAPMARYLQFLHEISDDDDAGDSDDSPSESDASQPVDITSPTTDVPPNSEAP